MPARGAGGTEGVRGRQCDRTPTTPGSPILTLSLPCDLYSPPSLFSLRKPTLFPHQSSLSTTYLPLSGPHPCPAPAHPCLLQNRLGLGLLGCHHGALVTPTAAKPELRSNGRFKFPSRNPSALQARDARQCLGCALALAQHSEASRISLPPTLLPTAASSRPFSGSSPPKT